MVRCLHIGDTAARLPPLTSPPSVIRKYGCATYVAESRPRLRCRKRPSKASRKRNMLTNYYARWNSPDDTNEKKRDPSKSDNELRNELRRAERSNSGLRRAKFDERTDLCQIKLRSLTCDSIVP